MLYSMHSLTIPWSAAALNAWPLCCTGPRECDSSATRHVVDCSRRSAAPIRVANKKLSEEPLGMFDRAGGVGVGGLGMKSARVELCIVGNLHTNFEYIHPVQFRRLGTFHLDGLRETSCWLSL